jgi:hypothetical protein
VETTNPAAARLVAEASTQSPGTTVAGDPPAPSQASSTSQAEPSLAEIEQAVLARISYDIDRWLPGWTIEFKAPVDGYRGMTYSAERRIEIYTRPGETIEETAHTLAHELGHAVDVTYNDDDDRLRWRAARGIDADHPWFVSDGLTDFGVGAGDFADCFAYWQMGGYRMYSELAGVPNQQQLNLLAEFSFD